MMPMIDDALGLLGVMSDVGGSAHGGRHHSLGKRVGCMRKPDKGGLQMSQRVGLQVLPWSPLQVLTCADFLNDGL